MNDFEYFGTIAAFAAGIILLVYLFKIRAKLMRKLKIKMLNAKAKLHYLSRPVKEDPWVAERHREVR